MISEIQTRQERGRRSGRDIQATLGNSLSSLFAANHLQQLAWYHNSELISFARDIVNSDCTLSPHSTVGDLLDGAFAILRRKYPTEYIFKACLLQRLLFGKHSPNTTACYFELPVAGARADMVLVNGHADVFEIKSRFDDSSRLASQLQQYYRCFTRVTVLAESDEIPHYMELLPEYVGLAALTSRYSISEKRAPSPYLKGLNHRCLYGILRQPERYQLGEHLRLPVSQLHPAERYKRVLDCFESKMSPWKAHLWIVNALKSRQDTRHLAKRCENLPHSLHVAAFSYRMRVKDWDALRCVLSTTPQ